MLAVYRFSASISYFFLDLSCTQCILVVTAEISNAYRSAFVSIFGSQALDARFSCCVMECLCNEMFQLPRKTKSTGKAKR
jgi:hypothetical protein